MYCFLFAILLLFAFPHTSTGKSFEERLEISEQNVRELKSSSVHKDERILHLEKTVQDLQTSLLQKDDTILHLAEDLSKANERIESLEKILENDTRKKELDNGMTSKTLKHDKDFSDTSNTDNEYDSKIVKMGVDVNSVKQHKLKSRTKRLLVPPVSTDQSNAPHVAFHAYQSKGRIYRIHQTVVFDVEEIDVGDGYNNADGIFVAPVAGVYVFAWTIVTDFHTRFAGELMVNGVEKGSAFMSSEEITDVRQATGLIVVHVDKGYHVSVRSGSHSNGGNLKSDTDTGRTTFSGWILFSQ